MYLAYAFYEFRETGELVLPIVGLPARVALLPRPTVASAIAVMVVYGAALGAALYAAIFRRLARQSPLSRVVASIGLFLYTWALVTLRFPRSPAIRKLLPAEHVRVFGQTVFRDRLYVGLIAAIIVAALWATHRFTRFGLATTATNESPKGAVLSGINTDRISTINWAVAAVLSGVAMVLIAPVISLDPLNMSLMIVSALGAALLGGLRSFAWVGLAGFAIGIAQSEIVSFQADWRSLSGIGLQQGVPFLVILLILGLRGNRLPVRGESDAVGLPASPVPRGVFIVGLVLAVVAGAVAAFGSNDWRSAIATSAISCVISLSVVVLTGFVGQISLAPYAFAGVAAFGVPLLHRVGVPFPIAPVAAVVLAMLAGLIVGLPGVKARGMSLAVATLAASVAVERLLFTWDGFAGATGKEIPPPKLFGLDLSVSRPGDPYPRAAFGVAVVVIAVLVGVAVAQLRRGVIGQSWMAVRSNERAAAAAGINVTMVKLTAFALSAGLAGLGGVMLGYQRQTLSTDSFQVFMSLAVLALTYLAGISSVSGAVIAGALAPLGVVTMLSGGDLTKVSPYAFVANGALLVVAAVIAPSGISGAVRAGWKRLMSRRGLTPTTAETGSR